MRTPARPLRSNLHHHLAQLFQTSGFPGSEQGCTQELRCAVNTQPEQGRKTTGDEGCSLQTYTHPGTQARAMLGDNAGGDFYCNGC